MLTRIPSTAPQWTAVLLTSQYYWAEPWYASLIANEMLNKHGDTTDPTSFSAETTVERWVIFGPGVVHDNSCIVTAQLQERGAVIIQSILVFCLNFTNQASIQGHKPALWDQRGGIFQQTLLSPPLHPRHHKQNRAPWLYRVKCFVLGLTSMIAHSSWCSHRPLHGKWLISGFSCPWWISHSVLIEARITLTWTCARF